MAVITNDERAEAYAEAVAYGKLLLGQGDGYLNPNSKFGTLSDFEWNKLTTAVVSGWIVARSKQLTAERFWEEESFLAMGEVPEPVQLGVVAAILPGLGDFVAKMNMTDRPIGEWTKEEILLFVWTAAELVNDARTARDERPGPLVADEVHPSDDLLMAG